MQSAALSRMFGKAWLISAAGIRGKGKAVPELPVAGQAFGKGLPKWEMGIQAFGEALPKSAVAS